VSIAPEVWTYISGGILILFGITLVFPSIWESIPGISKVSIGANKLLGTGYQKKSFWGDVLIGFALGPIFSTCSPTYFVILATVLPVSFFLGATYILAYVLGLSIVLLLIALLGQKFSNRLGVLSDGRGNFKRILGIIFVILGILIATGYEKKLQTIILDSGYFDVTAVEQRLLDNVK
jgi:cytochrome c biogenesis protein CcdA